MLAPNVASTSESFIESVEHTLASRLFFAFDVQVSRDEEELAKKRLEVKRGLPLQVCLSLHLLGLMHLVVLKQVHTVGLKWLSTAC